MITVGLLYGGRSGEHDVSRCSAASVARHLSPEKYRLVPVGVDRGGAWHVQDEPSYIQDPAFGEVLEIKETGPWTVNHYEREGRLHLARGTGGKEVICDVIFPAMHGTFAEDGTLQGMLELAMVPFVGAGMAGSLLGMDKDVAKRLVRQAGVPVVPWIDVSREQWDSGQNAVLKRAMNDLDLPFFVKPVKAGSSVGVSKVHGEDEFAPAMEKAFRFDNRVLVETGYDVDEIECSVLGNQEPKASVPGRVIPRHEFYSYESKYIDPEGADLEIPARISDEQARTVREYAVKVYRALQCAGMARVDFFLTLDSGRVFFNEINTLPGFTSISMYPKLWEASGIPYPELIDRLIELAFEKHERISRLEWEL